MLIDFGDIVVHVQHDEERDYQLERLWGDCPRVDLDSVKAPARPEPAPMAVASAD